MNFRIFGYEKELHLGSGELAILNVQNIRLFRNLIEFINNKEEFNTSNDFVIDEKERIKYDDFLCVDNIVLFQFDEKKVVGRIIANYLNYLCADEEEDAKLKVAVDVVVESFANYSLNDEFELYIDDHQISAILKALHISLPDYFEKILDKIDAIINIYSKLFKIRIYIFNNLLQYVELNDLHEIEKIAKKYDSSIILIENRVIEEKMKAKMLTITPDLSCY